MDLLLSYNHEAFNSIINLPSSKSISNRYLIMQALSGNQINIQNLSDANDTVLLQTALSQMPETIDVGNAGTAMRFLTAFLSIRPGKWRLQGNKEMHQRPIKDLVDILVSMGAEIKYLGNKGFPPLLIHGKKLNGGKIKMPETISSQYISALLLIAPYLKGGLFIDIAKEQVSRPYIDLSLYLMRQLGIDFTESGSQIRIPQQTYRAADVVVDPDWSAASYWYAAVFCVPGGKIILPGLKWPSIQGDSQIVRYFSKLGVTSVIADDKIRIFNNADSETLLFKANLKNYPDIIQTLAVATCLKKIPFHIIGVEHLAFKETDRLKALEIELPKIGALDFISGKKGLKCGKFYNKQSENLVSINTWSDHRMAMSFAIAVFKLMKIRINNAEVVEKSYPSFWSELKKTKVVAEEII